MNEAAHIDETIKKIVMTKEIIGKAINDIVLLLEDTKEASDSLEELNSIVKKFKPIKKG